MRLTPHFRTGANTANLAVALAVAGVAIGIVGHAGALGIPHNDDWSYIKPTLALAEGSGLHLQGWVATSLVGQIVGFQPVLAVFDNSASTLNISMAAVLAATLCANFAFLRRHLATKPAAGAQLCFILWPGLLLLGTSFMTDITAMLMVLLTLLCAGKALERNSLTWFAFTLTLDLVAVTIRPQTLAAGVAAAFIVVVINRRNRARLVAAFAMTAAFGFLTLAFVIWRSHLPGSDPGGDFALAPKSALLSSIGAVNFLGLVALPLLAWRSRAVVLRLATGWGLAGVLLAGMLNAYRWEVQGTSFNGNYLDQSGAYYQASYGRIALFPDSIWYTIQLVSVMAGCCLIGLLADAVRNLPKDMVRLAPAVQLLLAFGGTQVAVLVLPALVTGRPIFDRYCLPLSVVVLIGLMLRTSTIEPQRTWTLIAPATGLAIMSSVITWAAAADDAARWRISEVLVAEGADPTAISSGLEWQGTFSSTPAETARLGETDNPAYFSPMFPKSRDCYIVTKDGRTPDGYALDREYPYVRVPGVQRLSLYVFRAKASCQ